MQSFLLTQVAVHSIQCSLVSTKCILGWPRCYKLKKNMIVFYLENSVIIVN